MYLSLAVYCKCHIIKFVLLYSCALFLSPSFLQSGLFSQLHCFCKKMNHNHVLLFFSSWVSRLHLLSGYTFEYGMLFYSKINDNEMCIKWCREYLEFIFSVVWIDDIFVLNSNYWKKQIKHVWLSTSVETFPYFEVT